MLLDQQVVARVLAAFLRKLDHEIRKEMKLPEDNHDKHVAICTFNNVIDRMQEHVEAIRDGKESLMLPEGPTSRVDLKVSADGKQGQYDLLS